MEDEYVLVAAIFMGIQGSGKSTYYHNFLAEEYVHISLDELHTRKREEMLLMACISQKQSFVVDNTNPTKADRARYIMPAKAAGYRVAGYFFESRLTPCIERNERRSGKERIPTTAIAATSKRLEMPGRDEGFDELYFVKIVDAEDSKTGMKQMRKEEWRDEA